MASPYKTVSFFQQIGGVIMVASAPIGGEVAVSNIIICNTFDAYPFPPSPDDVVNVIIKNGEYNSPAVQNSEYIIKNYPISKGETLIIDLGIRLINDDRIFVSTPPYQYSGSFAEKTCIQVTYSEV